RLCECPCCKFSEWVDGRRQRRVLAFHDVRRSLAAGRRLKNVVAKHSADQKCASWMNLKQGDRTLYEFAHTLHAYPHNARDLAVSEALGSQRYTPALPWRQLR